MPDYRLGKPPANKGRRFPAEVLTRGEVNALLGACSRRGSAGIRNAALIVVLYRGGLRIAEALALELRDVDLEHGTLTIRHGKGDKRRVVGLDPQACAILERWLERRARLGIRRGAPVFCTISQPTPGRPMWHSYVREVLKDLAANAGVEKRVHPHGFRHTHAHELAHEGVPVHVIRLQLGHRSLDTTERYINHLAPMAVVRAMQAREWEPPGHSPASSSRSQ
jgi:integrase